MDYLAYQKILKELYFPEVAVKRRDGKYTRKKKKTAKEKNNEHRRNHP